MPPDPPGPVAVDRSPPPKTFLRFDRVERALHWVNAALFGTLMLTGAALYAGPVSTLVGHRDKRADAIEIHSGFR